VTWLNPAILYSLVIAAIPVILHALMRAKPKRLPFPALRLLQLRRKTSVRRLRLKHFWLMLLRILVLAGLIFAIARPTLPSANYNPTPIELATLVGIALAAVAADRLVRRWWTRQRLPAHRVESRQSFLRSGLIVGVILLSLLAVAWPYQRRIAAEISSPLTNASANLPAAAVFLFDTSLSMGYRQENLTRLEAAQNLARAHLESLPQGSRVAIAETGNSLPISIPDSLLSIRDQIASLKISNTRVPLDERLRSALAGQESHFKRVRQELPAAEDDPNSDRFIREIYVFTDLARTSWSQSGTELLKREMERLSFVRVYFVDVGVLEPKNLAISKIELSDISMIRGGELQLKATVTGSGVPAGTRRMVEMSILNAVGDYVPQQQKSVEVDPGTTGSVAEFSLGPLQGNVVQGRFSFSRDDATDPLEVDDSRYFSVRVTSPTRVLVVSERVAESRYWSRALRSIRRPSADRAGATVEEHVVTEIGAEKFYETPLQNFDCLCLINLRDPREADWKRIEEFVRAGGGLFVVLGMPNPLNRPVAPLYNSEVAQAVLPARLSAVRSNPLGTASYLDISNVTHGLFARFEEFGGIGDLVAIPFSRYWRVEKNEGASVLATLSDRDLSPALLERDLGLGRVLLFSSSVDSQDWNAFLIGWPIVAFADQTIRYLAGRGNVPLSFEAGESISPRVTFGSSELSLREPDGTQAPYEPPPKSRALGNYRFSLRSDLRKIEAGFSVNPSPLESRFERIPPSELDERLGEGKYQIANSIESLSRAVVRGRVGQELYPLLIALLIAFFLGEHLLANFFYSQDDTAPQIASSAQRVPTSITR